MECRALRGKEPQRWGRVPKGRQRLQEASGRAGSYARDVGRFLIRRLLFTVFVLFVVSLITFVIFVKLPASDPARRATGRATTEENIEAAREAFGLNRPVYVQYARFAQGLIPWPGKVTADRLTFLVAPTASPAGGVQISARVVETALHKMLELGFDVRNILTGFGTAPLAPIAKSDMRAIGRTNDCVLYGGVVHLTVRTEDEALQLAIIENVQRTDLNSVEEATGYQALINDFRHSHDDIAKVVGKSRVHITNTLRLLKLPETVQDHIRAGKLSAGHARVLIGRADAEERAEQIIAQGLNVRQVEELMRGGDEEEQRPGGSKTKSGKNADTVALERRLSDALGLKVNIDHRGEGGAIRVHYRNLDQLDHVVRRLERKG